MRTLVFLFVGMIVIFGMALVILKFPQWRTWDVGFSPMKVSSEQALALARSEAKRLGYGIETMTFTFVDERLTDSPFDDKEILRWGKVTAEEKKDNWVIYGFPMNLQPGGTVLVLIHKTTGAVSRTLSGQ